MDNGNGQRHRNLEQTEGTGGKGKRQHRDRFGVLNAFVDFTMAGLIRSDLAVWLVLYRDTKDGVAQTGRPGPHRQACRHEPEDGMEREASTLQTSTSG